jgi:hypothetical protein
MTIISDEEKPFSETKYVRERSDKFIVTYCPKTSDKRRWQMKSKRDQHVVLDNKRLSTTVTSETKRILEAAKIIGKMQSCKKFSSHRSQESCHMS